MPGCLQLYLHQASTLDVSNLIATLHLLSGFGGGNKGELPLKPHSRHKFAELSTASFYHPVLFIHSCVVPPLKYKESELVERE
jgi:hypothetical protein